MFEQKSLLQSGHQRLSDRLVPLITQGFPQKIMIATLQNLQEQNDSLQVKNRIGTRHLLGQGTARFCRSQSDLGCENDKSYFFRPFPGHGHYGIR